MKGQITISRCVTNSMDNRHYIKVSIQDETFIQPIIELQISLKEFAQCITGLAYVACKITFLRSNKEKENV